MSREQAYLVDILEAARLAIKYVDGKTQEQFLRDRQCQDAVVRRLEIVGEAARRLLASDGADIMSLPLKDMADMRNRLIHEYDGVDMAVVWDTVKRDLPPVVEALERIIVG